jgi:hypothetical protein
MCNIIEKESEIIRNRGGGRALVGSAVFKTVSRALITFWVGSIPMRLRQFVFLQSFLEICALSLDLSNPHKLRMTLNRKMIAKTVFFATGVS